MKKFFGKSYDKPYLETLLDQVYYTFKETGDQLTLAELVEGLLIMGSSGSGKSSGPGKALLHAMLSKGMGGLICIVKSDQYDEVMHTIKKAGRLEDVIHFHQGSDLHFNPIEYELLNDKEGFGEVGNIVNVLMSILELGRNYKSGSKGEDKEKFWQQSVEVLLNRSINLLRIAKEPVTIQNIRQILLSSFTSQADVNRWNTIWEQMPSLPRRKDEEFKDLRDEDFKLEKTKRQAIRDKVWKEQFAPWLKSSYFVRVVQAGQTVKLSDKDKHSFRLAIDYFFKQRVALPEKTRSIIDETFYNSLAEPFLDGILKHHFSGSVSPELKPENAYLNGKIILCDYSVKKFGLSGIFANGLLKLSFQRSVEARQINKENEPKPCFLWIDEYQAMCSPDVDFMFQGTARSSMCVTTYITQNLNSVVAAMGSYSPLQRAKSLIGNLGLKIFCANSDFDTNKYASEMLGDEFREVTSMSLSEGQVRDRNISVQYMAKVPPGHFMLLRTGRSTNKYHVDAILTKAGKKWKGGGTFLETAFDQKAI